MKTEVKKKLSKKIDPKKAIKPEVKPEVKAEIKAKKILQPLIIETLSTTAPSEKRILSMTGEKNEVQIRVPIPSGHVRCIVMKDYEGMSDYLYVGDVVDLPDRRFKSLVFRGYVEQYTGVRAPNKMR
jgi:hypothetical protein